MSSKKVIVIRKDLNMRKGKMIAQAGHGIEGGALAMWRSGATPESLTEEERDYYLGIFKKITVFVDSEQQLLDVHNKAIAAGLKSVLIEDSGLTEFHGVKTKTCIVIGPHKEDKFIGITDQLPLL